MFDIYFDLLDMHQPVDTDNELGQQLVFEFEIKKSTNPCICIQCQEINIYAEPNQPDGSFKCYSCRNF